MISSSVIYKKAAIIVALLLITISIIKSAFYTTQSGGTDLRNKVVAARLLYAGESPYFYKWHPGENERLADPNSNYAAAINGTSAAPGLLYFQSIFNRLPYPSIRILWTIFQYVLCLLIFGFILSLKDNAPKNIFYVILIGGVFFLCSDIWFFNIERGQGYIIYPFVMCLIYRLQLIDTRWSMFVSGVLIALMTYCRANFFLFALPLLLIFNKSFFSGLLLAGSLLLVHFYMHLHLWTDYFDSIAYIMEKPNIILSVPYAERIPYPSIIEGSKNLTVYNSFNVAGLPSSRWFSTRYSINKNIFLLLLALTEVSIIFFFKKTIRKKNPEALLLIGFILYIIFEYFVPHQRSGYNLIQWIFPVLLILKNRNAPGILVTVIAASLFLINGFPFTFRLLQATAEITLVICVFEYIQKMTPPSKNRSDVN